MSQLFSNQEFITDPITGDIANVTPAGAIKIDGSGTTQPISGSVSVSNFPATQPVSGTVAVSSVAGTVSVIAAQSSSATVTQVTSTGSNQTILASNVNRKSAILFFESGIWSVKYGATASTSSRTFAITSGNSMFEVTGYTGQIDAICTTAGKLVDITELV